MINWRWCSLNSEQGTRRLYSQRIRSYMGSHGAPHSPSITCTLSRHYNANRFIAPSKSCVRRLWHDHQATILRRLPGRQPLSNVAVIGTTLGTRTRSHGIPSLGMLQSSYSSVESVLSETRKGLDMQEASDLRRATRRISPYPLRLCWASKMWAYIITSMGITRSNGLVQTSSIVTVGTRATSECAGGYQANVTK